MKWTARKPSKSGIYWYRWRRDFEGKRQEWNFNLVEIDVARNVVDTMGSECGESIADHVTGKWVDEQGWYGPIASIVPPAE